MIPELRLCWPAPMPKPSATSPAQEGRFFIRGLLCTCAGAPIVLASPGLDDILSVLLGASISVLILMAAFVARVPKTLLVVAVASAFASGVLIGFERLGTAPLTALAYGVMCLAVLEAAVIADAGLYGHGRDEHALVARGAAYGGLGVWVLAALDGGPFSLPGLLYVTLVSLVLSGRWALAKRRQRLPVLVVGSVVGLVSFIALLAGGSSVAGALVPLITLLTIHAHPGKHGSPFWSLITDHPQRLLVGTFALMSVLGTLMLELPLAAADGVGIGVADALFTAVSAVCVTGLAVLDTATDFSTTGQFMILVLIQIGGLGIMTFSTVILRALGRRVSLRHEGAVARILSHRDRGGVVAVARKIILLTVISEGLGALALSFGFWAAGDAPLQAAWRGLFTAISAFCNAGFAIQSTSLIPYQHSPWILHTVALLIIIGGLAPIAALVLPDHNSSGPRRFSLHTKLVVTMTGVLLFAGMLFFAAFEWDGALAGLPLSDRLHNAWFQSVTLRTAGFNSVDLNGVQPHSLMMMLVWMLIGGAPGGTAGGIKVTTVAVIGLVVMNSIRGRWGAQAFGRRLSPPTIYKSLVISVVAGAAIFLAAICLLLTQSTPASVAIFEVVSALGTVGLSIGGTAALDGVGRAVIIVCMFVGRVGALSILMLLREEWSQDGLARPVEDIDIG